MNQSRSWICVAIVIFRTNSIRAFYSPLPVTNRCPSFAQNEKRNTPYIISQAILKSAVSKELSVEDFDLEDFVSETQGQFEAEEEEDVDDFSVLDFVDMVEHTKPGQLDEQEAVLLREIMTSIATENSGRDETLPSTVERLLFRMIDEWQAVISREEISDEFVDLLTPSTEDFVLAMETWASTIGDDPKHRNTDMLPTAVDHIMSLLTAVEDLYAETQLPTLKPNADIFRIVLRTLAASRQRGVDRKAWNIFKDMQQKHNVEPDAEMYHSMIFMSAKNRESGAANRAEKLLRDSVEKYPPRIDEEGKVCGMTIDSFNVVLTAWAKSGMHYGPERAENLIAFVEEIDEGRGIIKPTVSSFTSLIDAYAQTNEWDGVSHCERIFNRVLDMYLEGDEDFEPSIVSWTIIISAWARLSKKGNRGAAPRANRLLERMEALNKEGRIGFAPDAIVYTTVMNANAQSKTLEGTQKAQAILNEMNERYIEGDDSFKPTARSIKVVIDSWIRTDSPDKMDEAESILEYYEEHLASMKPPEYPPEVSGDIEDIYRSMLFGWAGIDDPEQAQAFLFDMVDRGMQPDSFCFDRVIEANTRVNDPNAMKRSYEVFEQMERCRIKGDLKPNERVYTSFIRAMIRARVGGMAKKARGLLRRMETLYDEGNQGIKPTVFTYNAVLMACAETAHFEDKEESLDALKIAVELFNELRQSRDGPDHVSFGNMLRCANLMPPGAQKDAFVSSTFQLCCKRGFVNQFVLRDLKGSASSELWESIFNRSADEEIPVERLPASWRRMFSKENLPDPTVRTFRGDRNRR